MSGRTRWMISATVRACASLGVDRSRSSAPTVERLRLALNVAIRIVWPAGSAAAAGRTPAAARISSVATARTAVSEVELHGRDVRARRAKRVERQWVRRSAGARADVAEVLLVQEVRHIELQFAALHTLVFEAVGEIEVDDRVARSHLVVEIGAEAVADLLRLQTGVETVGDVE